MLPKLTLRKLWLERNLLIFREKKSHPLQVVDIIKSILNKILQYRQGTIKIVELLPEEEAWGKQLGVKPMHLPLAKDSTKNWKIRLDEISFSQWSQGANIHSLFFDGAAKGNLGEEGGGRFKNPDG